MAGPRGEDEGVEEAKDLKSLISQPRMILKIRFKLLLPLHQNLFFVAEEQDKMLRTNQVPR